MQMTLEELERHLIELKWMEQNTPESFRKMDNEFWIIGAMRELYDMCKRYNQTEVPDFGGKDFVQSTKVVRLKTFIPDEDLKKSNWEYTFFCGMFAPVKGLFISKELMDRYFNYKIANVSNHNGFMSAEDMKELGLPEDFRPETIRQIDNGMGFGLLKGEINTFVRTWNNWEFLELGE